MTRTDFSKRLLLWHNKHGRSDLPWQQYKDPYSIWVSEIMLQQTQVNTVIDYFNRFIKCFPDIRSLANAPIDDVLALWSGLGYYARARNLHKAAMMIENEHQGIFPNSLDAVMALPGIGKSTAGAILAFSDNQCHPILDGNVKRVLCRYHGIEGYPGKRDIEAKLWKLADKYTPKKNVDHYTQAIMDLGATVCTRKSPLCSECPFTDTCKAYLNDLQAALPTSKPKKALPRKQVIFLLIENNQSHILLEKRPQSGIWGGLWSLPECDINENINAYCEKQLGFMVSAQGQLPEIKHSFSHYHLTIQPHRLKLGKAVSLKQDHLKWFARDKVHQLGLPKPVKSLLIELESEHE